MSLDAIQYYNDDGNLGDLGELECHFPPLVMKQETRLTKIEAKYGLS